MTYVVTLIALAAILLAAYAVREMRASVEAASQTAAKAVQALAQVKGLDPHRAAPEVFAPNNVAWSALERPPGEKKLDAGILAAQAREKRNLTDAIKHFKQAGDDGQVRELEMRLRKLEGAA